jgi:hypothetical protein
LAGSTIAQFVAPEAGFYHHLPDGLWSIGRQDWRGTDLPSCWYPAWQKTHGMGDLTLIVDDGFWFDTQKLQRIWT